MAKKIEDSEAASAMRILMADDDSEPIPAQTTGQEPPEPEPEPAPEEPAKPKGDTEPDAAAPDDLESLAERLRLKDEELESVRSKATESIRWGRDGYLKKSNELEEARALLKRAVENPDGVDKAEVERFLAGAAKGQDTSTRPFLPLAAPRLSDAHAFDIQEFLVESKMGPDKQQEFTQWFQQAAQTGKIPERELASDNVYLILSNAYRRFVSEQDTKPEVAKAIKSLAKTQKDIAKAAGAAPAKSTPARAPEPPQDFSKMSAKDKRDKGYVDDWLKTVMEAP